MKTVSRRRARLLNTVACGLAAAAAIGAMPATAQTSSGPVTPDYGKISPFYGKISAFYGKISPFYGKISPFYGNISAFWTNANPFIQTTDPSQLAFYGQSNDPFWGSGQSNPYTNGSKWVNYAKIAPFWSQESANWSTTFNAWQVASSASDYSTLSGMLKSQILAPADQFWDTAIAHGGKGLTATTIAQRLLAADGVTFNSSGAPDASSLAALTPTQESMFFIDFYDQLMAYSGTGHVDWWMGQVNWSPALQQIATSNVGALNPVTIGMLDFTYSPSGKKNPLGTVLEYGSQQFSDGHGAAVQGLITGARDGSGIMGVLPSNAANVVVYDPYDSTDTTNWNAISTGYATLVASQLNIAGNFLRPATVVNASLGIPGSTFNPGWNGVFSSNLLLALGLAHNTILVTAAGNEGVSQTTNVPWNFNINPTLLVVGSVGVDGTISNFSNTPGTACLVSTSGPANACTATLASRFIVAPGELILISDNSGNISRQTGTSLAAPLVTGAIGLLYARWPWLTGYANETANIILQSATKLGTNPGNDPVYGAGELNIQASQSPLNWSTLQYYPVVHGLPSLFPETAAAVVSTVKSGNQTTWNSQNLYFTAIETIGHTYRDFQIPLSSKLVGQTVLTANGFQQFQSYLNTPLRSWVAGGAGFTDESPVQAGMASFAQSSIAVSDLGGMQMRMRMSANTPELGYRENGVHSKTDMALIGDNTAFRFGYGDGAEALDSHVGFAESGDHALQGGGANPLLGLASGGAYVDYRVGLGGRFALNVGATERRQERDPNQFGYVAYAPSLGASVYEANAEHLGLDVAVFRGLTLHTAVTRLHENTGLLGVQSIDRSDLGRGSDTDGASLGFDFAAPGGITVSVSGATAHTTSATGQALQIAPGGLTSSSSEVALSKAGLFSPNDRLRFTVSKMMQVDHGSLQYSTYGVIDRDTGALGVINETAGLGGGSTPVSTELMYGRLFPRSGTEASFFLRADHNGPDATPDKPTTYVLGGKVKLSF